MSQVAVSSPGSVGYLAGAQTELILLSSSVEGSKREGGAGERA